MKKTFLFSILAFTTILLWQCQTAEPTYEKGSLEHIRQVTSQIDDAALADANANQGDWLSYGRNYQEDRYSELEQISKETIKDLGLAWTIDLDTKRGIQSTPIVVDGIMFFSGPWSVVYAVDVRKGELIWEYDPKVPRGKAVELCCGVVNRGVTLYKGDIFFGTLDGRLVSIDAADASLNWEVMTVPTDKKYSITGAPRIVKGNVLIGNGGAEMDARGFVSAYNAENGERAWRFYTVPGNPNNPFEHPDLEEAAKTWTGQWWEQGGGGTVWDAIVYDPELNLVYIGVGNGTHWNRMIRSPEGGDNLYLSSIVALNPDDGSYQWHFQTTPGDTWDYTATQPIILADIEIGGTSRKVLMQAPKNGFFYVIDRTNGEFIDAKAYSYMNWATGVDENGRPIEAPFARYTDGQTYWITPGSQGAHNWFPMSYNHKTGHVYIPTGVQAGAYGYNPNLGHNSKEALGGGTGGNVSMTGKLYVPNVFDTNEGAPPPNVSWGRLIAYDPIAQKEIWGVQQKIHYNGGLLSTATGLLFQGDAEGMFSARDVDNGEALWQFDVRSGVAGSPITYMVDGEQYVTIPVGWGGSQGQSIKAVARIHPGTLYTFKLGGKAEAPEKLPPLPPTFTSKRTEAGPRNIGNGFDLYTQYCVACHMYNGQGGGVIPDLLMASDATIDNYHKIILEGALESQGMPNFGEHLTAEDVEDIKSFVLYSVEALTGGMDPMEYVKEIATMQYMSDQNPPERKPIE